MDATVFGMAAPHALSGATTAVKSSQGSSINMQAGENLTYQFYTSRYTAGSYNIWFTQWIELRWKQYYNREHYRKQEATL